jgi:2-polyprenyl-3-methyl-5-hydroxy-6-metoxy-1,4-benzoquinol methylase
MLCAIYSQTDAALAQDIIARLDLEAIPLRHISITPERLTRSDLGSVVASCTAMLVIVSSATLGSAWLAYVAGAADGLKRPVVLFPTQTGVGLPPILDRLPVFESLDKLRHFLIETLSRNGSAAKQTEIEHLLTSHYLQWWEAQNKDRTDAVVHFQGLDVLVRKNVFSPDVRLTYSTSMAAQLLTNLEGKTVLDLGTGCGVLAILAAKRGAASVVAVDIDGDTVQNAVENVRYHGLEQYVSVVHSNLFEKVTGRFDVIVANLPIAFETTAWSHLRDTLKSMLRNFGSQLPLHLKPGGSALLTWASFGDQAAVREVIGTTGLQSREVAESTFGVRWQVYELRSAEQ